MDEPHIAPSADRQGVDHEDMLHAYRNAFFAFDVDEGLTLLLGGDRSGRELEIGVVRARVGEGHVIVHAMPARPSLFGGR